jgi:hypothetical protein
VLLVIVAFAAPIARAIAAAPNGNLIFWPLVRSEGVIGALGLVFSALRSIIGLFFVGFVARDDLGAVFDAIIGLTTA